MLSPELTKSTRHKDSVAPLQDIRQLLTKCRYVATFPVKMPVNDVVGINYALVEQPVNPYIAPYGAVTDHVGKTIEHNLSLPLDPS